MSPSRRPIATKMPRSRQNRADLPMAEKQSSRWALAALMRIERPQNYSEVVNLHLPYLVATAPFLIAARIMPTGMRVGPSCMFKRISGIPCMFCGYTRAFQRLARLDMLTALADNPAAVFLFAFMFAVALWNLAGLLTGTVIRPGPLLHPGKRRLLWAGVLFFFALNWVYRIINSAESPFCM
jgi:hypothetical protein